MTFGTSNQNNNETFESVVSTALNRIVFVFTGFLNLDTNLVYVFKY